MFSSLKMVIWKPLSIKPLGHLTKPEYLPVQRWKCQRTWLWLDPQAPACLGWWGGAGGSKHLGIEDGAKGRGRKQDLANHCFTIYRVYKEKSVLFWNIYPLKVTAVYFAVLFAENCDSQRCTGAHRWEEGSNWNQNIRPGLSTLIIYIE